MTKLEVRQEFYSNLPNLTLDPILAIGGQYKEDLRPYKVNASIGMLYPDKATQTWFPVAAQAAAARTVNRDRGYLLPHGETLRTGYDPFLDGIAGIVLGTYGEEAVKEQQFAAVATTGGTHALRIFFEVLRREEIAEKPKVLLGTPHYGNHEKIIKSCGFEIEFYKHLDPTGAYNHEGTLHKIETAASGSVILLQGRAHNPTAENADSDEQWRELAKAAAKNGIRVLFDLAYLGLDKTLQADARPVQIFLEEGVQVAIAASCSKNFGLYDARTGAFIVPTATVAQARSLNQIINDTMRGDVSSAPAEGQLIAGDVFADLSLFNIYSHELQLMAHALRERRRLLAKDVPALIADRITHGVGLYNLLPMNADGARYAKDKHAFYMLPGGRVSYGGITIDDIQHSAAALKQTWKQYAIDLKGYYEKLAA